MPRKAVTGPKNGKFVQANFTGNAKSRFPSLKTTKDLVLLSVLGNELCAGDYLGAIVKEAVANHKCGEGESDENQGKTTFLIADEIYWHNLKSLHPDSDDIVALKAQAIALGDNYFNENLEHFLTPLELTLADFKEMTSDASTDEKIEFINKLAAKKGLNFEIVRWRAWVSQDSADKIKEMIPLYDSVEGLNDSIVETVADFAKRHGEDEKSAELWNHRSKGYLTEESPSVMWLAASLGYNFVIYPGPMIPPFGTTKDFFVVENHKAKIVDGMNITDQCTHSDLCIHVKDPRSLVNWLQVTFKRSHAPTKVTTTEVTTGATPAEVRTKKRRPRTFFTSPSEGPEMTTNEQREEGQEFGAIGKEEEPDSQQVNPEQAILIDSLLKGFTKALRQERLPPHIKQKSRQQHDLSNELTAIFRGIAEGIMRLPEASTSTKIEMLTKVVETFVGKSMTVPVLPTPLSSSSDEHGKYTSGESYSPRRIIG